MKKSKQKKIAIIGLGKLGEALCVRLLKNKTYQISASTHTQESAERLSKLYKISVSNQNSKVAKEADIIILAIKPHQCEAVLKEIKSVLRPNQILISVCAAITTQQLKNWSGGKAAIVRAMPNTPAVLGEAMTVFCSAHNSNAQTIATATEIFEQVGRVTQLDESLMDAATGLSGCGPAYVFLIIEALSEAGVKLGLQREKATLLAAQTLKGAAQMVLDKGIHPAQLKDEVTTPAGCTIDGLMALEEGKLRVTLIKGVLAAAKKSKELSPK